MDPNPNPSQQNTYGGGLYLDPTSSAALTSVTLTAMSGSSVNTSYNTLYVASGGSLTQPTSAPTQGPTSAPTQGPTGFPTLLPTALPTMPPSTMPCEWTRTICILHPHLPYRTRKRASSVSLKKE